MGNTNTLINLGQIPRIKAFDCKQDSYNKEWFENMLTSRTETNYVNDSNSMHI